MTRAKQLDHKLPPNARRLCLTSGLISAFIMQTGLGDAHATNHDERRRISSLALYSASFHLSPPFGL
jgi:hypothetical protein